MFKNHLEMISRNETASKKAKFWQSFVGSLKGSQDLRAPESTYSRPRGLFRPISDFPELSSTWPYGKSIYDDPIHAGERIHVPGYRYDPLHRDIYGYSPRPIYPHNYNYSPLDRYRPVFYIPRHKPTFDAEQAWQDHLARKADRERMYPKVFDNFRTTYPFSRYPLYLVYSKRPQLPERDKYDPHRAWLDHLDRLRDIDRLYPNNLFPLSSMLSPTPTKAGYFAPRPSEVAFNYFGQPIYTRGGLRPSKRLLWYDLLNPSPYLPMSAITRDPWWWKDPELRPYRPYSSWGKSPFYLRDSYLSPVKRTYLWDKHPIRPFAAVY